MKFAAGALLSATLLLSGPQANAAEARIAAAANLKFVMTDLIEQFAKQTGQKIEAVYGSSGNLFSQISNGAPFDAFFSADEEFPRKLQAAGLAEQNSLMEYAVGRIAIWTPPGSPLHVKGGKWSVLLDSRVLKIAVANSQHAPYGRAALQALRNSGVYERIKEKLVYGEDISQAAQFVQSGNAQAGIIALSLILSPGMRDGNYWEIPEETHAPITQAAVVMKLAKNKKVAREFLEFVKTPEARATLQKYGFMAPKS